ncbi:MAG: Stp1/IreP family PP2C-type Ser/Thr phosphatase [Bacillota bacterium]|nr:Stp1/IreP family PP2C-type Ser/Thr phosphatase [Bacillota bacterium]
MVQIGFKCHKGIVRENNEDACFVIPSHDVYIVADGVGGNRSGEVASRTAVSEIAEFVNRENLNDCRSADEIFGFFYEALENANNSIYKIGLENASNRGMATTAVTAYVRDDVAYVSNIGDSRAYLFREGRLNRITTDHTYVNELISKGLITEEEAENHRQKNVITKALGTESLADPDFYKVSMLKGDVLMLCSDGLHGEVPQEVMEEVLSKGKGMNDTCTLLVEEAIKFGGRDNITVVCIKLLGGEHGQ